MIICVDFDGTLMDTKNVPTGKRLGPPTPGAAAAMNELARKGHTIVIFTVRGGEARARQAVADWLDFFHIPYSTITNIKVNADVYIDDKALRFDGSWARTLTDLRRLGHE